MSCRTLWYVECYKAGKVEPVYRFTKASDTVQVEFKKFAVGPKDE